MDVDEDHNVDFVVSAESTDQTIVTEDREPERPRSDRTRWLIAAVVAFVLVLAIIVNHARTDSVGSAAGHKTPVASSSPSPMPPAVPAAWYGLVDIGTRNAPTFLTGTSGHIWGFSTSGDIVALQSGHVIASTHLDGTVTAAAANTDGTALFVATRSSTGTHIADLDGKTLRSLGSVGFTASIDSFASYGNTLWVASDGEVTTLDSESSHPMASIRVGSSTSHIRSLTYLPTSGYLVGLVEDGRTTRIVEVDPIGRDVREGAPHAGTSGAFAVAAFGTQLWYLDGPGAGGSRQVDRIHGTDLAAVDSISLPGPDAMVFNGDQSWWSLDTRGGRVSCHDAVSGQPIDSVAWPHADTATAALLSDGSGVYLSSVNGLYYQPIPSAC